MVLASGHQGMQLLSALLEEIVWASPASDRLERLQLETIRLGTGMSLTDMARTVPMGPNSAQKKL